MRPSEAEINLGALRRNLAAVRSRLSAGVGVMAVVKADAYGHGAAEVAGVLVDERVDAFGVALVEEAIALRSAGIEAPIVVLGSFAIADVAEVIEQRLAVVVYDLPLAEELARQAQRRETSVAAHVKVDTGMNRLGLPPDQVMPFVEKLVELPGLSLAGLMTHFATADESDDRYLREQHAIFAALRQQLQQRRVQFRLVHCANSAAAMEHPATHCDMVRPGIVLYGAHASAAPHTPWPVEPVLTLRSAIVQLRHLNRGDSLSYGRSFVVPRDSLIATLPVGYGDGYPRALSNRGEVLVRGRRAPVVGNVCMDLTLIDVTGLPEVGLGDEVVLLGRQGGERISVEELARHCATVPHEIFCNLGPRLPRRYLR